MKADVVYVLHKNGANSHYVALDFLLKKNNIELQYHEFSVLSKTWKALTSLNFPLLKKQGRNFAFLTSLLFSTDKKIVLGIAPFDHKLGSLLKLLKKHRLYYHTSWICWDKSFHPKNKKNSQEVFKTWKHFLEQQSHHIFAVTEAGKKGLQENYTLPHEKMSVVYHSLPHAFTSTSPATKDPNSFLYTGRLVEQKGIQEILDFFSKKPEASVTIVGSGKLQDLVKSYADEYPNIVYRNYISSNEELKKEYGKHQFFILNSRKTGKWEELFGISLLEAMSQGTIPVATAHPGPNELVTSETGILFEEDHLAETLNRILNSEIQIEEMSHNCIERSTEFFPEDLAERWKEILS